MKFVINQVVFVFVVKASEGHVVTNVCLVISIIQIASHATVQKLGALPLPVTIQGNVIVWPATLVNSVRYVVLDTIVIRNVYVSTI